MERRKLESAALFLSILAALLILPPLAVLGVLFCLVLYLVLPPLGTLLFGAVTDTPPATPPNRPGAGSRSPAPAPSRQTPSVC